jgi:tetratricopeptide (TPR) repeat protein
MSRWFASCLLCLLVAIPAAADVKAGEAALVRGEWAEAESQFKRGLLTQKGPAHLGLAELYLTTGRYEDALTQTTEASLIPAVKNRALGLAGEVYREMGRTADALRVLQAAVTAGPGDLRSLVYLGITQQETGSPAAEKTLDRFFQLFNAGKIAEDRADQLTYTAMAARRLAAWQDAAGTFQSAVEKDPLFLLANLEWGELFLQKYNAQEAQKCFADVLKVNKLLPRALVGMAAVRVEAAYDVKGATQLADAALKTNPRYVPALNLKARLALDDEQFGPAEKLIQEALALNPVHLDTLALLAASRYLQDDLPGYEAARLRALKQNPRSAEVYAVTAELADRHHRYTDSVKLNRAAVALDPKNGAALAALGVGLLRLGIAHEAEGLKYIRSAFEVDAFNVRTFNTLNLYEKVIEKDYVTLPRGLFVYRFNKKEQPLLERAVPPLLQRFWEAYVKKYGFTPKNPITIELFTQRQHYGARTIGLPEFGAQGTCFGELITAMSPSAAEANWELVLAHELAHVFHLQGSNNRVPRWFTEGLAEYETNIAHPWWKREHALPIYLSLRRGNLWRISELSAAFTRPDRENGVVIAYQQSSLVIHYLAETFGFPKIVEALKLYGQGKGDATVLPAVTGKTLDVLDQEFQAFLRRKYPHYEKGFLFDAEAHDLTAARKAATDKPSDAGAQAGLAAALLEEKPAEALEIARKALVLDPKNVLARFVAAEALLQAKDHAAAKTEYEALLAAGTDGYAIRFGLGRLAALAADLPAAAAHLAAAKKWDPDAAEPYVLLMQLYEAADRREDLLKEAEAYLDVQEHDHAAARLLVDRFAADRRWDDLARIAPRVLGITPMEPFVHQQYGRALVELKRPKEAIPVLENALAAGLRRPAPTRVLLARQHLLLGDRVRARTAAEQALKEEPTNADAQALLKELG